MTSVSGWAADVAAVQAALAAGDAAGAIIAARRACETATSPGQGATSHRMLGDAHTLAGDRAAARAELTEALRLTAELPPRHPVTALVRNSFGVLEKHSGNFDAAAEHYAAALDSEWGERPEFKAGLLHNLGGLAHSRRDLPTAETHTRAALELHTELSGPASNDACADRGQLASIVSGLGRHDEAIALLHETIDGFTALYGPRHLEVGIARCTLGAAYDRAERLAEAEEQYREGLALREDAVGPDHPELAPTLLNLGRILDRRGDLTGGRALAERAVRNLEGRVVEDHRFLVKARRRVLAGPAG